MPYPSLTNSISAVLITKNEEVTLHSCLLSLSEVADEIIIIDSHSTDNTLEIIKKFQLEHGKVVLEQIDWQGYAATKNYGNSLSTCDYIISMDADEVIDQELREAILTEKKSGFQGVYSLNRLTQYCGKFIKHGGWYPEYKVRIFPKKDCYWQGDFVHETLIYPKVLPISRLNGHLLHYSFRSVSHHLEKVQRFSSLAAQEKLALGKNGSIAKLVFAPFVLFIKMYIIKLGFLDGKQGFIIAMISAFDRFIREAKIFFPEK